MKTNSKQVYVNSTVNSPELHSHNRLYSERLKEHEPLLRRVIHIFGFNESECNGMLERKYQKIENTFYPDAKMELLKQIVHECIFKVSCRMFIQKEASSIVTAHAFGNCSLSPGLLRSPLSLGTVYVLFHVIGLSEKEIAHALNIDLFQVKDRLARAVLKIRHT